MIHVRLALALAVFASCSSPNFNAEVREAFRLPGTDTYYDGSHDETEMAIYFFIFVMWRDFVMHERVTLSGVWLKEPSTDRERAQIGHYEGMGVRPDFFLIDCAEKKISECTASHEWTHSILWDHYGNPDSEIPLDDDGKCVNDGNDACSHAGGDGHWSGLDDLVITLTRDTLEAMGL